MVEFRDTESAIYITHIEDIEKFVNLKFPQEYKDHLLKYNGGRCTPNIFVFEENGKKTNSSVDWFLAIYEGEYDNLKTYIEIYKIQNRRIPVNFLPIAHDSGGNLICISCSGTDKGFVYFWDHEREMPFDSLGHDNFVNAFFIAKNFNEFLEGMKESYIDQR